MMRYIVFYQEEIWDLRLFNRYTHSYPHDDSWAEEPD